jgi:hypothetical protein
VASVFFQVAWTAYLPSLFGGGELVRANAVLQGSESAVQVAGPATGGALIAAVSAVTGLLVDALTFAISAVSLALIRRPAAAAPPPAPPPHGIWREIGEGIRWLAHEPLLRNLTLHGAAGNLALTGYGAITVVFLIRDVGVGTATVGLLMAASGLGGVVAATATPLVVRRCGAARTMVWAKVLAGFAALLIPLTRPGAGLIAFVAGTGLVAAFVVTGNVVGGTFRQTYVPPSLLGRVVTGMQFVNLGAIPLGALLGGALAAAVSTRGAIWVMAGWYAVSGLILLLGPWRGRRDLPGASASRKVEPYS